MPGSTSANEYEPSGEDAVAVVRAVRPSEISTLTPARAFTPSVTEPETVACAARMVASGGDLAGAYYVDQSQWKHLDTFEELATKNAGVVFAEMEFE